MAVIVTNQPAALAAKAAGDDHSDRLRDGSDPVSDGLVASLNRPGGNVTGVVFISSALGAEAAGAVASACPKATMIAVLANPVNPETEADRRDVQTAAQEFGLQLILSDVAASATSRQPLRPSSNMGQAD